MDDTDLSTRANTEPVYDCLAKHGFWGTKTVWPLRARRTSSFIRSQEREVPESGAGDTLEDTDYLAFIRHLQEQGFEIALHGIAAGNSNREEIKAGLAYYQSALGQRPALNAFHRTNVENLYCGEQKLDSTLLRWLEQRTHHSAYEGHVEGMPAFWGDIARETFRYVRLPFHTIAEINTLKLNPSMPFVDPRRPYVRRWFTASDGGDVVRFTRLLRESAVRRLVRERGTCIIYTHFAKQFARRQEHGYRLDREFEESVRRVTARPEAWFATATTLLDRLEMVKQVALVHQDRELSVTNHGPAVAAQVVLRLPPGLELRLDGQVLDQRSHDVVLPDLAPGATLRLTTNRPGRQMLAPLSPEIPRRERLRIEYANYRGLIKGWASDRMFYASRHYLGRNR